jgi:hypothetical protein
MLCFKAIQQTTAETFAAESECDPALAFERKLSASLPSQKKLTVAR